MISKGRILRLLRESLEFRQEYVADTIEISSGYLSSIEQGKKHPSNDVLQKLADLYKVPLCLLVWDESDLGRAKSKDEKELVRDIHNFIEKLSFLIFQRDDKKATV